MPSNRRRPAPAVSVAALRGRRWSPLARAAAISAIAIAMAALFVTTYSLALGNPVPHGIPVAVVGDPVTHSATVLAVAQVAGDPDYRAYESLPAALNAVDWQEVYAALDLTADRPTLYVASAAGASVARALVRASTIDPDVLVIDTHPLGANDPNGVDIFYLMLGTTILGFVTTFQVRANAAPLSLRAWTGFVLAHAVGGSLVLTLVAGPVLRRLALPVGEVWAILTLQLLAAASFASLMAVLAGKWAILPTWLFFVVLGNSSSGGAISPPLLPPVLAFASQWLPSGATVTAVRNAVYFPDHQHLHPVAVLVAWAVGLFVTMVAVSRRRRVSPGVP
ncbi:MAG: hypothetical protein U0075_10315 [Thermomicrobiales bacterium]